MSSSIPVPARAEAHPHLRPLNVLRDLAQVADLVELCFAQTMDQDGASYVRQMRRASQDEPWLHWAAKAAENASSIPLNGYVWEEDGRIVGNTSIINYRHNNKRLILIANVAVHPNYRHRGIARALTERAVQHGREHNVHELWLHVRDDNPEALHLYSSLGFTERARRSTWLAVADTALTTAPGVHIVQREARFWSQQRKWLERLHPDDLGWYRSWNFDTLAPGLWNWFYLFFVNLNLRQWAAISDDKLQAVLAWMPTGSRHEPLWLALGQDSAPHAVTSLLVQARRELGRHKLTLDHPVGPWDDAIHNAGFHLERTLIWMRADGATK